MTLRWFLTGLTPALAMILLTPARSQAQVEDWGSGWIHPAYTSYRAWFPPRHEEFRNYNYYPAPAAYDPTYAVPRDGSWWYYPPAPASSGAVRSSNDARVRVEVPAHAQVWFDGSPTTQTGADRVYQSPPLDPKKSYGYKVRARWTAADGKVVDQTRKVQVRAGQTARIDFLR